MNEWISIKDKQPEDGQLVTFIVDKNVDYYGGSVCSGRHRLFDYGYGRIVNEFGTWGIGGLPASYWIPVPELPKDAT